MVNKLVFTVFFVALGIVANPTNARASVVTFGCVSSITCTLSELTSSQASIVVGKTQFGFEEIGGSGIPPHFIDLDNALVTGLVVNGNPALKFHGDPFFNSNPDLDFLLGFGDIRFTLKLNRRPPVDLRRPEFPTGITTIIQDVEFGPFLTTSQYQYGFDIWDPFFTQQLGDGLVTKVNPRDTSGNVENILSHSFVSPDLEIGNLVGVMDFSDVGQFEVIHVFETKNKIPPVPLPAAFWLFSTALIGFFGYSSRRKTN